MSSLKKTIARALLCFALVSLGFALGRMTAGPAQAGPAAFGDTAQVVVYYFHAPVRCATCNKVEAMTKEVVQSAFAPQLRDGRVVLLVADYQEREDLATRYDIASSGIVVVKVRGGAEVEFTRLDEAWFAADEPLKFRQCVTNAVARRLEREGA